MLRYIKLYFTYVKRSIITRLEYKGDTFISIFTFIATNVASILSIYFVMSSIPSLKGWTMAELGFLYGFSMMPIAIDHIFTDDLWNVAYWKVRFGKMDRMFTKPVSVLFQTIAETFQFEGFGELIVGIAMLCICGGMVDVTWSFPLVLMLVVATIFGALIISSLKIIFASFAFVFKRSGPVLQMVYNFSSYTKYPIKIYPAFIRAMLTFLFPFAIIISYPVEAIFGNSSVAWINSTAGPYVLSGIIIASSMALLFVAILIWNFFEKRYESTGS